VPFEIQPDFVPRRFLRSGHLQTLVSHFLTRESELPEAEKRLFRVDDGVQVACHCHWQTNRQAALTAILVHGLEGSSSSQYIVGTANKAWVAGMNVVRMNVRGCGGTETLGASLYHSGLSTDVGEVVRQLTAEDALARIAIAGFSMGGNMVLKLAGEWGSSAPSQVKAIAAVSPGMDLSASADALHLRGNRIYELRFLVSLWRSLRRKAKLYPQQYRKPALRCLRSIRDFDDAVTAPAFGFQGAQDYYTRASATPLVARIAVPALVIHAVDDPFVRMLPSTVAALRSNPNVTLLETAHGGHCGFLADPNGYDGRWAERQIVDFFGLSS
jgi:predicted alpha/beta-fold hydrolase